mgnify:CR=1 FL=1
MGLFEILKGEQPGLIKSLLHYENVGQYSAFRDSSYPATDAKCGAEARRSPWSGAAAIWWGSSCPAGENASERRRAP